MSDPIPLPCTDCGDELLAELVEVDGKWSLRIRRVRNGNLHVGIWTLESLAEKTENHRRVVS